MRFVIVVKVNQVIHTLVTEEASPSLLTLALPWLIHAGPVLASWIRDTLVTVTTLPSQSTPETEHKTSEVRKILIFCIKIEFHTLERNKRGMECNDYLI